MHPPCSERNGGDWRAGQSRGAGSAAAIGVLKPCHPFRAGIGWRPLAGILLLWLAVFNSGRLVAASDEPDLTSSYNVQHYVIEGKPLLATNVVVPLFIGHTGTNVTLREIVSAAYDLEAAYHAQGLPAMNIVIAPHLIANGRVTLTVFQGAVAQILVAGNRYPVTGAPGESTAVLGAAPAPPAATLPASKTGPFFLVNHYTVLGNTVLPPSAVGKTLSSVDGAFGTNVTVDGIRAAAVGLQTAYSDRGYITVAVSLPRQSLTNGDVKIKVTEGRLAEINVKGNHYFSSNNVMRALPGLHTNLILNSHLFQAELDRANASQDRQIYPRIGPGPDPGTSDLTLIVKDRFPLHAKVELNNESSPGTPDLRVNSSAVLNNLWQREQSLGLQYSFSPELYKGGSEWSFYDQPLVANYSGFYRIPLGGPAAIADAMDTHPGSFGYDEATHKFNLPPASGQPDVTFFASRSSIDTGIQALSSTEIYNVPGVRQVYQNNVQQDLTENNDLGVRFSAPLSATETFHQDLAGGLDFKTYSVTSSKTNNFVFNEITIGPTGIPNPPVVSTVASPVPTTVRPLQYLPLNARYTASVRDALGQNTFGLGIGGNAWFSGPLSQLQAIASSKKSTGHWFVITPSYVRTFELATNWVTTIRADGQWSTEPLISNEQFGGGGVNSVRGYQEGQVFGDTGWHVTLEQQTPPQLVGYINPRTPVSFRGIIYTDYAQTDLLDPQGRSAETDLWGAGFGVTSAIGSHWDARFLFSVPLRTVATTPAYSPFFNFALTAQF